MLQCAVSGARGTPAASLAALTGHARSLHGLKHQGWQPLRKTTPGYRKPVQGRDPLLPPPLVPLSPPPSASRSCRGVGFTHPPPGTPKRWGVQCNSAASGANSHNPPLVEVANGPGEGHEKPRFGSGWLLVGLLSSVVGAGLFWHRAMMVRQLAPPLGLTSVGGWGIGRGVVNVFAASRAGKWAPQALSWHLGRLSYILDSLLERYWWTYALILFGLCTIIMLTGGMLFYRYRNGPTDSFGDAMWDAWGCLCTTSSHLKARTFVDRTIGLMLAIGGLLCYSLLTSTMTAQFKSRMEALREGAHSRVMESGHIVIAGVNDHIPPLLRQLNKSQEFAIRDGAAHSRKQTVLLLSEAPRKSVEKLAASFARDCPQLELLIRTGSLSNPQSFDQVGADKARTIVILQSKADQYEADAEAVLSVLALRPFLGPSQSSVVVEVCKPSTAQLMHGLGRGTTLGLQPVQNLASKLFVQCTRQRGLIDVYRNVMDHENEVVNLRGYPELEGVQFRDVRRGFHEAVVCGLLRDGAVDFHPSDDTVLQANDRLMVVAPKHTHRELPLNLAGALEELKLRPPVPAGKDPLTAAAAASMRPPNKPTSFFKTSSRSAPKERIVMCGWRKGVADMAAEYDHYLGPGSQLVILAETPRAEREDYLGRVLEAPLRNLNIIHQEGNPLSYADLRRALVSERGGGRGGGNKGGGELPTSIVIIADQDWSSGGGSSKSDKQTIFVLLQAEALCREYKIKVAALTAELSDSSLGDQVVRSYPALSYVGTSELMGLFTSQVTEHSELNAVWTELLNPWGNEIYVKDMSLYMDMGGGERVTFSQLAERAVVRGEVAIGYRQGNSVVVNPTPKDVPIAFSSGDALTVIAEFERDDEVPEQLVFGEEVPETPGPARAAEKR